MSTVLQDPSPARPAGGPALTNPFRTEQAALLAQGGYFLLTGLWPLFSIDSFQAVTGPKTDLWLVRTVGLLIAVIGAVLLLAVRRQHAPAEVLVLAIGASLGLAFVDVSIVFTRAASPVYLLDAVLQAGLVAWWVTLLKPAAGAAAFPGWDSHLDD